ncbi:hypothetical protein EXN66_Car021018 [Channa argus]|uniref:Uncharacterized protein n=1 Tax=Channa argus TaxID=215402 RepID=A0A6G1QS78_CHAAH|nr:hypothetical protein EXN66_Car021018 [Channa argus]
MAVKNHINASAHPVTSPPSSTPPRWESVSSGSDLRGGPQQPPPGFRLSADFDFPP